MNSQEFKEYWAANKGMTLEEFEAEGYVVLKCCCPDDPRCQGWSSMLKDMADIYLEHMPGQHGYRYPEAGE